MIAQSGKATRIDLFSFFTPQMRAFHVTWLAFFLAFFGWFGIAPLMSVVRTDLGLTKEQIGNTVIASVSATVFARLLIGWICDRIGPRITYAALLVIGSIPVMTIGLAQNYESFLLFRLGISVIGASFVITQYHTSLMFAPNVVGTANATTAGWGNLGLTTDICVSSTARDAFHHEFHTVTLSDCTAEQTLARHEAGLASLAACFGRVCTANEVLAAWQTQEAPAGVSG